MEEAGCKQSMTDKQFNGFIRLILNEINEVLQTMSEGKEKDKLQHLSDNLQQMLEDKNISFEV